VQDRHEGQWTRRQRGRRRGWPVGLATVQLVIALVVSGYHQHGLSWPQVGLLIAGPVALGLLGRRPVVAGAAVGVINLGYLLLGFPFPAILPSTLVATVRPFARARREAYWQFQQEERRRREAERQRSQEEERRQAADERVRIARELHDILAHSLSLINVRASVALEVMQDNPGEVRPALQAIKQASRDGLTDVRAVLATINPDGEGGQAPRAPAPDLSRLAELVRQAEAAGLRVELETVGTRRQLPAAVELAAYRIIQEALTNIMRHSGARSASLVVQYAQSALSVGVADPGPAQLKPDGHVGGSGLVGIRERAASLGGTAAAAPDGRGGFTVMAMLPASAGEALAEPPDVQSERT
jgi:signal transduction histidine kinase